MTPHSEIEYFLRRTGAKSRPAEAFLHRCEGHSHHAVAVLMNVTVDTARVNSSAAYNALALYDWDENEVRMVRELLSAYDALDEGETDREHAKGLLAAHRNSQGGPSSTPEMDDNLRKAANHDPVVDLRDAENIVRNLADLRERERQNPWQRDSSRRYVRGKDGKLRTQTG